MSDNERMTTERVERIMFTTLRTLRDHNVYREYYDPLVSALGQGWGDDQPIPLTTVLDLSGLDSAIWALRTVGGIEREMRHFACDCAEHVLPAYEGEYDDDRPRRAIETARRYADGEATPAELRSARLAARAAESDMWDYRDTAAGEAARAATWVVERTGVESVAVWAAYSAQHSALASIEHPDREYWSEREYQAERFLHWFGFRRAEHPDR